MKLLFILGGILVVPSLLLLTSIQLTEAPFGIFSDKLNSPLSESASKRAKAAGILFLIAVVFLVAGFYMLYRTEMG